MSAVMTLDIRQLVQLDQIIGRVSAAETRDLMERIGIVAENAISDNFEGERDPDGVPWKPSFRARAEGGKTLTDKGLLAGSITSNADADSAEAGSNMIYARIHNDGGVIRGNPRLTFAIPGLGFRSVESVTMPQRQFVGWGRDALDDAKAEAEDWLAELLPPGALS